MSEQNLDKTKNDQPQEPTLKGEGSTGDASSRARFWDCADDAERLTHETIAEAVEDWVDQHHPAALPDTVEVYGFNNSSLPSVEKLASRFLSDILERLDEDYGADDDPTLETDAMQAAALAFMTVLRSEYRVWRCHEVAKETVRIADYMSAEELAEYNAGVPS